MFYPKNIEEKIGFDEIRDMLRTRCLSQMGRERVDDMSASSVYGFVALLQAQLHEMITALNSNEEVFNTSGFYDLRAALKRIRVDGSWLEIDELGDLKRSLETIADVIAFVRVMSSENEKPRYHFLYQLSQGIDAHREIAKKINDIIDKFGNIKDSASPQLAAIRSELNRTKNSIGGVLHNILHKVQEEGLVETGVQPTIRDGRLVIPVAPALKRKIRGIVHDESATGKTVYIEPAEVVEANNRIRELEGEERREIIRILQEFTNELRPAAPSLIQAYAFLGIVDFIRAKALVAQSQQAIALTPVNEAIIDWGAARHPILESSLKKHGKKIVPLDIELSPEQRILVISGPNAGGKSICLKTVGLLQYMYQCGLAIPVNESSQVGIFNNIMIDIGDEQSIDDELSTYSSHLLNMKNMMRTANSKTLLLIDEFGGGTEPTIGGAMAEAILMRFVARKAFAVITTHYQNLKEYADKQDGVANGAMLYDRNAMQPLFTLSVGRAGSSFAIEIARKIGIPEEVINDVSDIVGQEHINADKYLQDIVRDKMYWEKKRQNVHLQEKKLQDENERLIQEIEELRSRRNEILGKAREQAKELLEQSNARIEATIKDIKEAQAERGRTKDIRQELDSFKDSIKETQDDELINKKMAQIEARQQRKQQHKQQNNNKTAKKTAAKKTEEPDILKVGDTVRIKEQNTVGTIESIKGDKAFVTFGMIRTNVKIDRLTKTTKPKETPLQQPYMMSSMQQAISERQSRFHRDIDLRGMRGEEALRAVQCYIDDAVMLGVSRVRILHGTGEGILRTLIRQYLQKHPDVSGFADEHVQFGGVGITVVDL